MATVDGFQVDCGDCGAVLVERTSGELPELLKRSRQAGELHACTASILTRLVKIAYSKLTGPRLAINGKRVKFSDISKGK